ncbi:helix-turn-helix domain-containing protein [Actinomadura parmotrematis]|uniref:DUF5753 domain-containing protein n=1 Tax=Actinomadura parmotrematis TaxID=2864039 RepID=A0ABS7FM54_9ACTN|nr:DUF5753 domain-containing protein [Actinomadura parmotrematis]MBW8481444.1 DUF5753 domain-containing protein [Actinomadura parmotrematis]
MLPHKLTPNAGPRHLFGSEVRFHREAAELSLRGLADMIPFGASTISEIERGLVGCDLVFAELTDGALSTGGALTRLHVGLFDGRAPAFPDHFVQWPQREGRAELLRAFQPLAVWGLFQIREYAETQLYGDVGKVEARMRRRDVLTRETPPRIVYLVPEHILWHRVGSPEIMYAQLLHLADSISSRVAIQVLPDGSPHPGHLGAFVLARLPGGEEVAYAEAEPHGQILDGRSDLEMLNERFTELATYALPADMSGALIRQTAEERWKIG